MSCRRHLSFTHHAIEIYRLRFARGCGAPSSLLRFCGAFGSAVGLMLSLPFTVEVEAMNATNNPSLPKDRWWVLRRVVCAVLVQINPSALGPYSINQSGVCLRGSLRPEPE